MESKDGHRPLTAKIVGSYLRHHKVGASQLSDLIAIVHRSLSGLGQQPLAEEALTPAVSVRQSVRPDYVVCLDCGYRGKTLRRHISSRHGLSRDEYLRRWGLQPDHPLTAPAYSERRSTLAKQFGLGRKPKADRGSSTDTSGNRLRTRRRGISMRFLNRDGLLAPDRSLKPLMKQRQSRRNRGRGDRALRKPRHNLSHFRHRPPKLNREPNSVLEVIPQQGSSPLDPATADQIEVANS